MHLAPLLPRSLPKQVPMLAMRMKMKRMQMPMLAMQMKMKRMQMKMMRMQIPMLAMQMKIMKMPSLVMLILRASGQAAREVG